MALLTPIDSSNATPEVQASFDMLQRRLGRVPRMIALMANSPSVLDTYLHFNHALERTTLSAKTRALITVTIAEINGCDYMRSLGMRLAVRQGVPEADLSAARLGQSTDPKTNDTLQLASSIVRNAGRVPHAELDHLRRGGFSDQEIVDIIAAVSLNIFRNYFNLVVGTEIDSLAAGSGQSRQLV